jgi:hypothetical protein
MQAVCILTHQILSLAAAEKSLDKHMRGRRTSDVYKLVNRSLVWFTLLIRLDIFSIPQAGTSLDDRVLP